MNPMTSSKPDRPSPCAPAQTVMRLARDGIVPTNRGLVFHAGCLLRRSRPKLRF